MAPCTVSAQTYSRAPVRTQPSMMSRARAASRAWTWTVSTGNEAGAPSATRGSIRRTGLTFAHLATLRVIVVERLAEEVEHPMGQPRYRRVVAQPGQRAV